MKFINFDNLFDKTIHINKSKNLKKFDSSLYKIIKNSCIINLTYTSIFLYKLYKIFYILHSKNLYVTLINKIKFNNNKSIKTLLKFTNNNFFNSKNWINGFITTNSLNDIIALGIWVNNIYKSKTINKKHLDIPFNIFKIINKLDYVRFNLKFKGFSKFVFLLNIDKEKYVIRECLLSNKFIMGLCSFNYNTEFIDFFIYCNNISEISLNFIIKFITIASINGVFKDPVL